MKLTCSNHGREKWRFTIICVGCKRVYQAVREGEPFVPVCHGAVRSPERCVCGLRLPGKGGSARPICTPCFIERVAS